MPCSSAGRPSRVREKPSASAAGRSTWGQALRRAEEERRLRESVALLPENAQRIWEALGDARHLWRVLHACGGPSLRVPKRLPDEGHPLCRLLGRPCLRKLIAVFGGTQLYVPRCEALLGKLRQREIIAAFSRSTGRGVSSTAAVAALARRYSLSDRRIWQILKQEAPLPASAGVVRRLREGSQPGETA
ncbi:MAG: Mor transcription activator family protein [Desulfovibrionaceae bacterium]|nr:Mor transcription activator family protein [Desulfovibrionaceae bacterium]